MRGERHDRIDETERTMRNARSDLHGFIDRVFDSVNGFMHGIGRLFDGGASRATQADAATVADLGEWYVDEVLDAATGRKIFIVTNGERTVECRSREMASEVIFALNERGVKTSARTPDRGAVR